MTTYSNNIMMKLHRRGKYYVLGITFTPTVVDKKKLHIFYCAWTKDFLLNPTSDLDSGDGLGGLKTPEFFPHVFSAKI